MCSKLTIKTPNDTGVQVNFAVGEIFTDTYFERLERYGPINAFFMTVVKMKFKKVKW